MLADALSDAETYKRKYTEEKRRADHFEKLSQVYRQAVIEAKPNPTASSPSPVPNKSSSPSTATPSAVATAQSPPTDPASASAGSNSSVVLADPKALAELIETLSEESYRAACARDDEQARRLCISSLWKQLRQYLEVLDVHSKQARDALDKRIEQGGGDIVDVQRAELVEVQGPIPALRDVATFTRVYDENGRESASSHPQYATAGHSPSALRRETKSHHSGRRPRSGSLEPPPDGYPPSKRSRNQVSHSP
jgi:hypothetical protein